MQILATNFSIYRAPNAPTSLFIFASHARPPARRQIGAVRFRGRPTFLLHCCTSALFYPLLHGPRLSKLCLVTHLLTSLPDLHRYCCYYLCIICWWLLGFANHRKRRPVLENFWGRSKVTIRLAILSSFLFVSVLKKISTWRSSYLMTIL